MPNMRIIINNPKNIKLPEKMNPLVRRVFRKAAEVYGLDAKTEVGFTWADDEYIRELNGGYRGKDYPTDVLSFAMRDETCEPAIVSGENAAWEILLGDIVVSWETAVRQAEEYGHSPEREVAFLTVHGMLHLLGYGHEEEAEEKEMRREEEHLLALLGIGRR